MSKGPKKRPRLKLEDALDRFADLTERVRKKVESRRAFSCEGCDARCCRVERNAMLVTRLETEALLDRVARDPALADHAADIAERVSSTAARLYEEEGPELPTFDCPFLGEDLRCLVHGRGQPLGCITFMPLRDDMCDHPEDEFVEAFDELVAIQTAWLGFEDREGELLPIAVQEAATE